MSASNFGTSGLRAIRHFVVERAKAFCSVAVRGGAHVANRKSKDFRKRMLCLCLICHVRKSLCGLFDFFEQFPILPRLLA